MLEWQNVKSPGFFPEGYSNTTGENINQPQMIAGRKTLASF